VIFWTRLELTLCQEFYTAFPVNFHGLAFNFGRRREAANEEDKKGDLPDARRD
jgi:hypothetical protein